MKKKEKLVSEIEKNKKKGIYFLKEKNLLFRKLVDKIGVIDFRINNLDFECLVKIIISQQLSNSVANKIFFRLKCLFPKNFCIKPTLIMKISDEDLRKTGISYSKITFIKGLANELINSPGLLNKWKKMDDKELLINIKKLNGFGDWSANIVLLFNLGRQNIFPLNDATLKKAYLNIYGSPLDKNLECLNWAKPYRSLVALYFWKWVDKGMIDL